MIYLIRSWGRGGKSLLKVGYTSDLKERMGNYYCSNPLFETIGVREGTRSTEKRIHLYLEALGYKSNILEEWFIDTPVVISLFHDGLEKMGRVIWRERDKLFSKDDLGNTLVRTIYEDLRRAYHRDSGRVDLGSIDWHYKNLICRETLRKVRGKSELWD